MTFDPIADEKLENGISKIRKKPRSDRKKPRFSEKTQGVATLLVGEEAVLVAEYNKEVMWKVGVDWPIGRRSHDTQNENAYSRLLGSWKQ